MFAEIAQLTVSRDPLCVVPSQVSTLSKVANLTPCLPHFKVLSAVIYMQMNTTDFVSTKNVIIYVKVVALHLSCLKVAYLLFK